MSVYPPDVEVRRGAILSDDGAYRYALTRSWGDHALLPDGVTSVPLTFIMLNPSTADADADDPTIRRCVGFARRMGYPGIRVHNLYAYRATKPADLWEADLTRDIIGPDNDTVLRAALIEAAREATPVVAAWGAGAPAERVEAVCMMTGAEMLWSLGTTKSGAPRHPLYVPADTNHTPWRTTL